MKYANVKTLCATCHHMWFLIQRWISEWLNGKTEWSEQWICMGWMGILHGELPHLPHSDSPFRPVQFVTPVQIETFPIYIKLDQCKLLEKFLRLSHSCWWDCTVLWMWKSIKEMNKQPVFFSKKYTVLLHQSQFLSLFPDTKMYKSHI